MAVGDQRERGSGGGLLLPIRYVMAIFGSVGLAILYGFKVNASIAIIAMVNHTAIANKSVHHNASKQDVCGFAGNATASHSADGPFPWSEKLQGIILAAYFAGYLVSLMPGGRLAERWSAKSVMSVAVMLNVIGSVLTPISANIHWTLFVVMRFIQGIGGGVSFPAMHVMISKWAPPVERSLLVSIVYAGTALGTVISIVLTGLLAHHVGWASIFYIEGGLCLFWSAGWWFVIADSPEEQTRFITQEEKDFIVNAKGSSSDPHDSKLPVPWKKIFTSVPFLAILAAHTCSNFGWYLLLTQLPKFMNTILMYEMKDNTVISALPFFCMWLLTMILSKLLAILEKNRIINVTVSRKIGTIVAAGGPALCLIGVMLAGCNRNLVVVFMTIGTACMGAMYCGFLANHIDIAPNFAGTLVAITNSVASIPGVAVPVFVGILTEGNQTMEAWRTIFIVIVIMLILEIIVFTIFGSGKEQSWNTPAVKFDGTTQEQQLPLQSGNGR